MTKLCAFPTILLDRLSLAHGPLTSLPVNLGQMVAAFIIWGTGLL